MKTRTVLYAEEGMVLTDGEIYGKQLFLADGVDPKAFYEIPEEDMLWDDAMGEEV